MTDKKYNVLDPILQNVMSQCISFSHNERKEYNAVLKKVLDNMVEKMKEVDDVFKCLYQKNIFTGSFYENLRISKPDEFDINLVFSLPLKLHMIYSPKQPGFMKFEVNGLEDSKMNSSKVETALKAWSSDGFLSRSKFLQWMQGVFNKAISNLSLQDVEVKPSASGPALTIIVIQPLSFSVDLVPVIEFKDENWPSSPVRKCPAGISCNGWYTVPKAPDGVDDTHFWRMSFYNQEKEIMKGLNGMKPIIKLLKLLRENYKWKFLSSYAIKSIFLWEEPSEEFWRNGLGFLFMHMLTKLMEHGKSQKIPFYWDKNLNLLKGKPDTISNMTNCLDKMIKKINQKIEENPLTVVKFFGLSESLIQDNSVSSSEVQYTTKYQILDEDSSVGFETNVHVREEKKIQVLSITGQNDSKTNKQNIPTLPCDGASTDNILTSILQEQKECKQYLLSISQQMEKLYVKVDELKAENNFLRNLISKTNTNSLTFSHNLIELDEPSAERHSRPSGENSLLLNFS